MRGLARGGVGGAGGVWVGGGSRGREVLVGLAAALATARSPCHMQYLVGTVPLVYGPQGHRGCAAERRGRRRRRRPPRRRRRPPRRRGGEGAPRGGRSGGLRHWRRSRHRFRRVRVEGSGGGGDAAVGRPAARRRARTPLVAAPGDGRRRRRP